MGSARARVHAEGTVVPRRAARRRECAPWAVSRRGHPRSAALFPPISQPKGRAQALGRRATRTKGAYRKRAGREESNSALARGVAGKAPLGVGVGVWVGAREPRQGERAGHRGGWPALLCSPAGGDAVGQRRTGRLKAAGKSMARRAAVPTVRVQTRCALGRRRVRPPPRLAAAVFDPRRRVDRLMRCVAAGLTPCFWT